MTHPEMVAQLAKSSATIYNEFNPFKADLVHAAIGLASEAGEILTTVKKHFAYNTPLDRENLREELGDLEFFLELFRRINGFTREGILASNMEKLAKRYNNYIYSDAAAKDRKDKQ